MQFLRYLENIVADATGAIRDLLNRAHRNDAAPNYAVIPIERQRRHPAEAQKPLHRP